MLSADVGFNKSIHLGLHLLGADRGALKLNHDRLPVDAGVGVGPVVLIDHRLDLIDLRPSQADVHVYQAKEVLSLGRLDVDQRRVRHVEVLLVTRACDLEHPPISGKPFHNPIDCCKRLADFRTDQGSQLVPRQNAEVLQVFQYHPVAAVHNFFSTFP